MSCVLLDNASHRLAASIGQIDSCVRAVPVQLNDVIVAFAAFQCAYLVVKELDCLLPHALIELYHFEGHLTFARLFGCQVHTTCQALANLPFKSIVLGSYYHIIVLVDMS